jgi:TIR domain-containing protein
MLKKIPRKVRKKPGSFEDRFIRQLSALCEGEGDAVTNSELMKALDWPKERYNNIKIKLLDKKLIARATGHGGKVRLLRAAPDNDPPNALNAFISYSHVDKEIQVQLRNHLKPLNHIGLIDSWSDLEIAPGDEWERKISTKLEEAHIIILLISIDFINSHYCYDEEMARAMERHQEGSAVVIPVIARQCLWHQAPFGKLEALPEKGKAIVSFANPDDALMSVAEGIRKLAEALQNKI